LRIPESDEKLDNTDIHPDQYKLAKYIIEKTSPHSISPNGREAEHFFLENKSKLLELYSTANITTLNFILEAYSKI